jgi:thymidylate synthase
MPNPYIFEGRNVNDLLPRVTEALLQQPGGQSRNGPVRKFPHPVIIAYDQPQERVLFNAERDANPFFHLVESLWMLAGRSDLATLTPYVKRMAEFSDDGGKTQPGAYGYRWRRHFDRDQLPWAINRLRNNPNDRRVVIQMYDADRDQEATDKEGRDIPCNLTALLGVNNGKLDLTVYNRSNDAIWGALGANAVHFSVLQEYLASKIGLPIGRYYQISNNLHGYDATINKGTAEGPDFYESGEVRPTPMFNGDELGIEFDHDLAMFFDDPARAGIRNDFLRKIACPMVMAHRAYKDGDPDAAREIIATQMPNDNDWRKGAEIWLSNRKM